MEELTLLRKMVEEHDYEGALSIISELDEMAKDDKINKIRSFLGILLIHLIKQQAEQRVTKSWNRSIENALDGITTSNKRRSAGGYYLRPEELSALIDEAFPSAIRNASYEAFEGTHSSDQLAAMIDTDQIKQDAFDRIMAYRP
ncbi:DUF29 family protein [Spirosoma rhododendri]|uniref:DUF29 domain-containing protein n=1 Tax=Spirosoma rhododendri TaxID=2728024 RepID=A0A7L5DJG9_9BACT|nr:DUF29 family protein [Spirosoma rhododendri]QJD77591.1 DUF29 domain-containing protein [Spirosoma rhododendri]